MRYAAIIDRLTMDDLSAINPPTINPAALGYVVQALPHKTNLAEALLKRYLPSVSTKTTTWYGTLGVGAHIDGVGGGVTIGVVSAGDHYLFTERDGKIGILKPGVVFLLHNKHPHGALPNSKKRLVPLVFAAMGVSMNYADVYRKLVTPPAGNQMENRVVSSKDFEKALARVECGLSTVDDADLIRRYVGQLREKLKLCQRLNTSTKAQENLHEK